MASLDLEISQAILAAKPQVPSANAKNAAQIAKVAEEFESVFINEVLGALFEGVETSSPFGGGPGEAIFRSLMLEEYSKTIASQGGFGLADAVKRQLLAAQEANR